MTRIINLKNHDKIVKGRTRPDYVSYGRGVCRATGGMAHQVVERVDSKGRKYAEDIVTGKRVIFEKSIAQRTMDHDAKVLRRVNNLLHKTTVLGLTAKEFETLSYLASDEIVQTNYALLRKVQLTLTGHQFDAGKIISRR